MIAAIGWAAKNEYLFLTFACILVTNHNTFEFTHILCTLTMIVEEQQLLKSVNAMKDTLVLTAELTAAGSSLAHLN
jgi:hypothetical protein